MRYETHEKLNFEIAANNYNTLYVKSENIALHIYERTAVLTDLDNAGQKGKGCIEIGLYNFTERTHLLSFFCEINWELRKLFTLSFLEEQLKQWGAKAEWRALKAYKTFSPFNKPKKLTSTPKKWNSETVYRALANGQGFDGKGI